MMVLYLMVVLWMIDSNCYDDDDDFRTECFVCLKGGTRLAGCQGSMVTLYPAMIMMMILLIHHDNEIYDDDNDADYCSMVIARGVKNMFSMAMMMRTMTKTMTTTTMMMTMMMMTMMMMMLMMMITVPWSWQGV